ncbi:la protein 1-like [Hordeum vulgare subsp. vulgare]|nr:la protein 1-like [Hordeum vulgare subsp. vulgare]
MLSRYIISDLTHALPDFCRYTYQFGADIFVVAGFTIAPSGQVCVVDAGGGGYLVVKMVNSVRPPKHVCDKRHFCGTALIEFSEEDEANNIMNNKLSFAGADLEIKTKKEFDAEMEAKKEAYEKSHPNTHPNKNGHDEGYPKGLILAFKLKKILADGDTEQNGGDKVDNTVSANKEGASESAEESGKASEEKAHKNTDAKEEKSDDAEELIGPDAQSVKKDDKSPSENDKEPVSREDFKEYFAKFGTCG